MELIIGIFVVAAVTLASVRLVSINKGEED
jgi:hypothetical protein